MVSRGQVGADIPGAILCERKVWVVAEIFIQQIITSFNALSNQQKLLKCQLARNVSVFTPQVTYLLDMQLERLVPGLYGIVRAWLRRGLGNLLEFWNKLFLGQSSDVIAVEPQDRIAHLSGWLVVHQHGKGDWREWYTGTQLGCHGIGFAE